MLFPAEEVFGQKKPDIHQQLLAQKFALARAEGLAEKSMSEIMAAVGQSFLQTPYKAHTLEVPGSERLVVNLQELDCVTFVESTLAIARCITLNTMSYEEYKKQLQLIRYRGGVIDGYTSRLHYFSDWIDDNEKKGVVRNIAQELGGAAFERQINFMTTHRDAYKQLKSAKIFNTIVEQEEALNARKHFYLPKESVQQAREHIWDGDIIGIVTTTEGLDIAHTGMAIRYQGYLRFLHAPLSQGAVQITKRTIADHLGQYESHIGIMIARPLDPAV